MDAGREVERLLAAVEVAAMKGDVALAGQLLDLAHAWLKLLRG